MFATREHLVEYPKSILFAKPEGRILPEVILPATDEDKQLAEALLEVALGFHFSSAQVLSAGDDLISLLGGKRSTFTFKSNPLEIGDRQNVAIVRSQFEDREGVRVTVSRDPERWDGEEFVQYWVEYNTSLFGRRNSIKKELYNGASPVNWELLANQDSFTLEDPEALRSLKGRLPITPTPEYFRRLYARLFDFYQLQNPASS